jgi:hypothetical protein
VCDKPLFSTVDRHHILSGRKLLSNEAEHAWSCAAGGGQPLQKAPNWMKRPVSACLGFGGRLVKVINQRRPVIEGGPPVEVGEIHLSQVRPVSFLILVA